MHKPQNEFFRLVTGNWILHNYIEPFKRNAEVGQLKTTLNSKGKIQAKDGVREFNAKIKKIFTWRQPGVNFLCSEMIIACLQRCLFNWCLKFKI